MCPWEESNFHLILRSDLFYPLNYKGMQGRLPPIVAVFGRFSTGREFIKIYYKQYVKFILPYGNNCSTWNKARRLAVLF